MTTLSKDERESIIQEALERVLLRIPEVIGNLVTNHTAQVEINKKFYDKYPEFKNHKDSVMAVVELVESKFPHLGHEKILEQAVPEIRKRIKQIGNLDTTNFQNNPDRQFQRIEPANIDIKTHGEL